MQLRRRKQILLEGLAASLQLSESAGRHSALLGSSPGSEAAPALIAKSPIMPCFVHTSRSAGGTPYRPLRRSDFFVPFLVACMRYSILRSFVPDLCPALMHCAPSSDHGGGRELSDLVFLRLVSLPKGRKLIARYLQLLPRGSDLSRTVVLAIMRHLRFLFGGAHADPGTATSLAGGQL